MIALLCLAVVMAAVAWAVLAGVDVLLILAAALLAAVVLVIAMCAEDRRVSRTVCRITQQRPAPAPPRLHLSAVLTWWLAARLAHTRRGPDPDRGREPEARVRLELPPAPTWAAGTPIHRRKDH